MEGTCGFTGGPRYFISFPFSDDVALFCKDNLGKPGTPFDCSLNYRNGLQFIAE